MLKNIKYKKTHMLLTLLEVILIVMISGWYYYSESKMGMIRHIMFRNIYKFPYRCFCINDFNTIVSSNKNEKIYNKFHSKSSVSKYRFIYYTN